MPSLIPPQGSALGGGPTWDTVPKTGTWLASSLTPGNATFPDSSKIAVPSLLGRELRESRISDCAAHLCIPRSRTAAGMWQAPRETLMVKGRTPSVKQEDRLRPAGRTQPATGTSHGLLGALTATAERTHTCGRSLGSKSPPGPSKIPCTGFPANSLGTLHLISSPSSGPEEARPRSAVVAVGTSHLRSYQL